MASPCRITARSDTIPSWGKLNLVDALALLLQDRALLEHDVLELGGKQCEVFRGERSQKQIAPARARVIQFHPQPFSSSATAPTHGSATTRPTSRRHW